MITTQEALMAWPADEFGPFLKLDGKFEVRLEKLLWDGQFYLAIYDENKELVVPKVVMKPGKVEEHAED